MSAPTLMSSNEVRVALTVLNLTVRLTGIPPIRALVQIFNRNRELFYNLALVGVGDTAHNEMKELELLARRLQRINRGYRFEGAGRQGKIILLIGDEIETIGIDAEEVRSMCNVLYIGEEEPASDKRRASMEGVVVSLAYVEYRCRA